MHIDPTTLALQLVNFLALVLLLRRFLFKPVLSAIDRRDTELAERHRQADALGQEAAAARDAAAAERTALAQEAGILRAKAREAAEEERRRILDAARRTADALHRAAEERIRTERDQAEAELLNRAGELALDIAARLLSDARPDLADSILAEVLRQELAALPAEERAALLAGDAPLAVATARDLPPALRDALVAVLPAGRAVTWNVDPALIAGIELTAPHHLIQHSWRAALAVARDGLHG